MNTAASASFDREASQEASAVSIQSPERRVASWLILLSALVTVLILWGGIVRLSGSGLSIPDWPLINGSLLPPFSAEGWAAVYHDYATVYPQMVENLSESQFERMFAIEYFHRFLAALVGVIYLAIFVRTRRNPDIWKRIRRPLISGGILLVSQAVLGGIVVKTDLKSISVASHLGLAFLFFALLLWTALGLLREARTNRTVLSRLPLLATGFVWLQIVTGGLVAGTGAGLLLNTWPKIGAYWVPPFHLLWADWYTPAIMNLFENQVLIQFIHRWLAFVAAGFVIALIVKSIPLELSSRGRLAARAAASILVLQVLLGIGNLLMKVPFWMAFAHLATGLLLFTVLLVLTHEIRYARAQSLA